MAGNINDLIIADDDYLPTGSNIRGYKAYAGVIVNKWDKYIGILQAILDEEIIMGKQTEKIASLIARAQELKTHIAGVIAHSISVVGSESLTVDMEAYIGSIDMADDILY